jgi:hypothetical protein
MQIVQMPEVGGNRAAQRKVTIAVDIGRYHFITWDGWHVQWDTKTPREWWQKQLWEKEGGYSQDENLNNNHDPESGRE